MPLTVRQNGTTVGGQPNNAQASWWNDFHDLLTGVMTDQPITLANSITNITSGTNINNGTVTPPFRWSGVASTAFFAVLDIKPTDAGQTEWLIGYNGGDGHLQIQQATGNIDVVDIDTSGNVYFAKDVHATGSVYLSDHLSVSVPGLGNNWITVLDMLPSGTPTTNNHWQMAYNGQTGDLLFYDVTHGRLDFYLSAGSGTPYGANGPLGQMRSAGGGAAGGNIWVGTTDPGTAAGEGDIWIKA